MRAVVRFLLSLVLGIPASGACIAQTIFTTGDCNANVTISGAGLTLTSTNSGVPVGCRASQAKQSGLLYFTATVNASPIATVWGIGSGGVGTILPAPIPYWSTAAGHSTGGDYEAAVLRSDGSQFWNNTAVTGGGAVTSGKTVGIAINLNTDPWQMWVTSDISGTS